MKVSGGTGFWGLSCVCVLVACSSSSGSPAAAGGAGATAGSSGAQELGGAGAGGALSAGGSGGSGGTAHAGAAAGGSAGAGVCAHELANAACWQQKNLQPLTSIEQSFFGAVFDGRYLVYANEAAGDKNVQVRFDTQGDFTGDAAWSTFDAVAVKSGGVRGGAFDGRYVYLAPFEPEDNGAAQLTYDSVAVRYDSQAAFNSLAAWSTINLTRASGTQDLTVPGFAGTAFDGRYVYFAPTTVGQLSGDAIASGKATRFDSQADFTKAASWSSFDLTTVSAGAAGFAGAVFDGRYLYFAPHSQTHALAVRYDTQADFATGASWETFETTSLNQYAGGFQGAVFDGRYIYFVPTLGGITYHAVIARYDTQASFTSASAWTAYDTIALNNDNFSTWAFDGGVFDGRYVYFIPRGDGPLVRVDTTADFSSNDAWSNVELLPFASATGGFSGGAFDGRYLYLVPNALGPALRFDAGASASLPAANKGSFF
jgi:hypothetical protein